MAAAQEQTTAQCSSDVTPHVKHGELRRKFLQVHVINVQLKNRKEISSGVLRLHAQTTQSSTCNKETLSSIESQLKQTLHNKYEITNEKIMNHNLAFRFCSRK